MRTKFLKTCKNVYGNFTRLMNIYVAALVSVYIDGVKCHILLINLNELHLEFLRTTDYQESFPKFCQLYPKWCVTPVTYLEIFCGDWFQQRVLGEAAIPLYGSRTKLQKAPRIYFFDITYFWLKYTLHNQWWN